MRRCPTACAFLPQARARAPTRYDGRTNSRRWLPTRRPTPTCGPTPTRTTRTTRTLTRTTRTTRRASPVLSTREPLQRCPGLPRSVCCRLNRGVRRDHVPAQRADAGVAHRQVARAIESPGRRLLLGDPESAADLIGGCTRRVRGTAALYRARTTISPESFDVIRAATDGRRPRGRGHSAMKSSASVARDPTCSPAGGTRATRPPARGLRGTGSAWCAMKRSHWGIARKVIGDVPGTGVSVEFALQARLDRPLFAQVDSLCMAA